MIAEHTQDIPGVAVIGSGYWGKNLVRNFHQLGALKLICDKNEALLDQFKGQYHDVELPGMRNIAPSFKKN